MQYKIPQNVAIEDKIVGPLTLRQLIMLAIGFGISYTLFAILSKMYELNIIEYIIIALPGLVAVAFALVKINGIPLLKFFFLFLEFSIKPKKRIWDHRGIASLVSPDLTEMPKEGAPKEEAELDQKSKKAKNLKELTNVLDSGGFDHVEPVEHKDIDDIHDDNLVSQAYFGHKESDTGNMYWRTTDEHKKMLDFFATLPVTELKTGTKGAAMAKKAVEKVKEEVASIKKGQTKPKQPIQAKPSVKKPAAAISNQQSAKTAPKAAVAPPSPQPKPAKSTPPKQAVQTKPEAKKAAAISDQQSETIPSDVKPAVATPPNNAQPTVSPSGTQPTEALENTKKKPRKRKRKIPQPVRKNNQVNTTQKTQPAEYIPKTNAPQKADAQKPQKAEKDSKVGELHFEELQKGDIEINLD